MQFGANVFGARSAVKQSKYQQDILSYQAKYLEATRKIEEERIRRDLRKILGAQRAATAASGFTMEGTPLELQVDSEMQADIDIALLRQAGSMEQLRLRTEGRMARAEGEGMASGLYLRAGSAALETLLSQGARHGWFEPRNKITVPKLTERQMRLGV